MIDDMSDAVALLSSGNYTVTRRPGSATVRGRKVEAIAAPAWANATLYTLAQQRSSGGNVYEVTAGGTSAASPTAGPSGTGTGIVDGTVAWKWVAPATSTLSIVASVQPVTGRELERLPEAMRSKELLTLFTATQLLVASATSEPDVVSIDGDSYEVQTVERWNSLGNYYRALAAKVGR